MGDMSNEAPTCRNGRDHREPTPMTNEDFAEQLGITESYASYLRTGGRKPSAAVLVKLSTIFHLDANALMDAYQRDHGNMARYLGEHFPRA